MSTQDFLFELGSEELPPKALAGLADALRNAFARQLDIQHLGYERIEAFATPRRLALLAHGVAERQEDSNSEIWGPPLAAAFDADGNATKAAEGFARKCGVNVEQLEKALSGKVEKLVHRAVNQGLPTIELLPGSVQKAVQALPIPKRMRWGSSRVEFVRPVHWLVMVFGGQVIECELLGLKAGNLTYGHRFHHNAEIEITAPQQYEALLQDGGYVIARFETRQAMIEEQVKTQAAEVGGHAVIDPNLLREVTALVEWPVALTGRFDRDFLRVPEQALISSMKEHQKYFHVVDDKGVLLPCFITVSNIESKDPEQVIQGNERVIRPRLADSAFFFDTDLKTSLESRLEKLKTIVFQNKLGTVYEKAERLASLSGELADLTGANKTVAARAALLSKADLVSQMVGEFPDLQGTMGYYYAHNDAEPAGVAEAIREHYQPAYSGDNLPESLEGCCASLADKLDTIAGLFAIGQPPTGEKDPFAIRRAALGVLRIIIDKQLDLDLRQAIDHALSGYTGLAVDVGTGDAIFDFMLERLRAWFQDEGVPMEVFQAVHARRPARPLDFQKRIYAVQRFATLPAAVALAAANKRVSNILAKQAGDVAPGIINAELLVESAERALADELALSAAAVAPLLADRDYAAALDKLAPLRPTVDAFFDNVMVMTDEEALRNNRLALLNQLRELFLQIADISLLQATR